MSIPELLRREFLDPPASYRGAPFWSWNDRLEPEELVRQVGEMKAQGMGGFFMHSREGLETEYLGREWMACVRETVRAAKEQRMRAWLYDEDRWPSGGAGGLVPSRGDAYRAKALVLAEYDAGEAYAPDPDPCVQAVFRVLLDVDGRLSAASRLQVEQPATAAAGERLLVFRRAVSGPHEWFNGEAPADNLNPEAVAAFIESTHEAYRREIGEDFGAVIPGIFTDEPGISYFYLGAPKGKGTNYVFKADSHWLPWTDGLADYFRARRGYDLLDHLPHLFFAGSHAARTRHDYWRTITERFAEAYSRQLSEWCARQGIALTGHFMAEESFDVSTWFCGAIMPHLRYQQVPGIDMLREQNDEDLTVKQATSVAHQYGRKHVLSETYGCTGWEFTFEGQKWVGDWQYALGVTLRCQHLALYTLRGCRKRDYPPCFNYNTTWWPYNHVSEDYFARLGRVLTEGEPVRDVLILHPGSTAWSMMGDDQESKQMARAFSGEFSALLRAALAAHYDFDLGDETIMAEAGRVADGRLLIEKAAYRVVVAPSMRTLFASTERLLSEFLAAGGRVIVVGEPPTQIEAEDAPDLARLWLHPGVRSVSDVTGFSAVLEEVLPREVSLANPEGLQDASVLYHQRRWPGGGALFIRSGDRASAHKTHVRLRARGRVEEWDPLTGRSTEVAIEPDGDYLVWTVKMGPAGSRLYLVDETAPPLPAVGGAAGASQAEICFFGPLLAFRRTAPNALTLDVCAWRLAAEAWSAEMPVWQAQRALRERLGMRQVYYNGLPQRYKWVGRPHPRDGTPVEFQFHFEAGVVPKNPVYLVLEGTRDFAISMNGAPVSNTPDGWYLDRSFDRVPLPAPRPGRNELVLSCAYVERMEVEDCYLVGDFGVDHLTRHLTAEPVFLRAGDWCLQGYPHYAGGMVYGFKYDHRSDGRRALLYLGNWSAVTVAVRVDGKPAGHIPWRDADGLDITGALHEGANTVEIEVVGSPRNLLGPLHQARGRMPWTDWQSFRREGEDYTPEYVLEPYGLMGQVRIEWNSQ